MKNTVIGIGKTKGKEKDLKKQRRKRPAIVIRPEDILDEQNDESLESLPQEDSEDTSLKVSSEETEPIDFDDEEVFEDDNNYSDFDLAELKKVDRSYFLKVSNINGEKNLYLQMDNIKNLSDERLAKIEDYLFFIAKKIIKKNETLFSNPFNLINEKNKIKKISSKEIVDALLSSKDSKVSSNNDKEKLKNYISYLIKYSYFDINRNIIELKAFFRDYRTLKMEASAERFVEKYKDKLLEMKEEEIGKFYKAVTGKKLSSEKFNCIKELLKSDNGENSQ